MVIALAVLSVIVSVLVMKAILDAKKKNKFMSYVSQLNLYELLNEISTKETDKLYAYNAEEVNRLIITIVSANATVVMPNNKLKYQLTLAFHKKFNNHATYFNEYVTYIMGIDRKAYDAGTTDFNDRLPIIQLHMGMWLTEKVKELHSENVQETMKFSRKYVRAIGKLFFDQSLQALKESKATQIQ